MIWSGGPRLSLRLDWTPSGWRVTPKGSGAALAGLVFGGAAWSLPWGPRVPLRRVIELVAGTGARLNAGPVDVFVGTPPPVRLNAD